MKRQYHVSADKRNGRTSEGFSAGVYSSQTFGRPKVRDLQNATVGVYQDIIPLRDMKQLHQSFLVITFLWTFTILQTF